MEVLLGLIFGGAIAIWSLFWISKLNNLDREK